MTENNWKYSRIDINHSYNNHQNPDRVDFVFVENISTYNKPNVMQSPSGEVYINTSLFSTLIGQQVPRYIRPDIYLGRERFYNIQSGGAKEELKYAFDLVENPVALSSQRTLQVKERNAKILEYLYKL